MPHPPSRQAEPTDPRGAQGGADQGGLEALILCQMAQCQERGFPARPPRRTGVAQARMWRALASGLWKATLSGRPSPGPAARDTGEAIRMPAGAGLALSGPAVVQDARPVGAPPGCASPVHAPLVCAPLVCGRFDVAPGLFA